MKRRFGLVLGSALIVCTTAYVVGVADAGRTGKVRIVLMNDRVVEGDIKELPDGSYEVTTKHGAVVKIKQNEVKRISDLEPALAKIAGGASPGRSGSTTPGGPRGRVSDEEIEALLAGIELDSDAIPEIEADPEGPLPSDEEGKAVMMKFVAGTPEKNLLETDHFMMIYTSEKSIARALAARLEAIYRWNVKLNTQFGIKNKRPKYRLRMYFFGTHEEFNKYQVHMGMPPDMNTLGFFLPLENYSCFFDMETWPPIARWKEAAKRADPQTRRALNNLVRRGASFKTMETIQHEAAHQIHDNIGTFNTGAFPQEPPRWIIEGYATMFEQPPGSAGAAIGAVNNYRVYEFRLFFGRQGRIPVDYVRGVLTDDGQWFQRYNYWFGWSMTNYLYRTKREKFKSFMKHLSQRPDGANLSASERMKEFEDFFGSVDQKWVDDYVKYTQELRLLESQLPPDFF